MVLIAATTIAVFSAAVLQLSSVFSRRQVRSVHDSRAFYLAEASLSEAYYGLTVGKTGNIGSMVAPAGLGDGLVWVEATPMEYGLTRLEATALSGVGRSSLAIHVQRTEQPIGVFASGDVTIDQPVLVDGYDSGEASYARQVGFDLSTLERLSLDTLRDRFLTDGSDPATIPFGSFLLFSGGDVWHYVFRDEEYVYGERLAGSWLQWTLGGIRGALQPGTLLEVAGGALPEDLVPIGPLGPTTAGGGQLGSNGSITFETAGSEIYGDVVPGPDHAVRAPPGVSISGLTLPRKDTVVLEPVEVPELDLGPGLEHDSPIPFVVAPSEVGFRFLRVLPGGEAAIVGPATVVVGQLELRAGAVLAVQNLDGPVNLVVLGGVELAWGSTLLVDSEDPADLSLLVAGRDTPVNLFGASQFRGAVYAPEADVWVEAPFEVFGVLVAGDLRLGPRVRLHFDSGIAGRVGPFSLPRLISWEIAEIPSAVRIRTLDPFQQLGVQAGDVASVSDAQETLSWTARVGYTDVDGKGVTFEGPYEQFTYERVGTLSTFELIPPDSSFPGDPWLVFMDYDSASGQRNYDGLLQNVPTTTVTRILERIVTPPQALRDQGWPRIRYAAGQGRRP